MPLAGIKSWAHSVLPVCSSVERQNIDISVVGISEVSTWCPPSICIFCISKACTNGMWDAIRKLASTKKVKIFFIIELAVGDTNDLEKFANEICFFFRIFGTDFVSSTRIKVTFEHERICASKKSKCGIHLLCHIHTITIFLDHFFYGFQESLSLLDIGKKLFFVRINHSGTWKWWSYNLGDRLLRFGRKSNLREGLAVGNLEPEKHNDILRIYILSLINFIMPMKCIHLIFYLQVDVFAIS